MNETETPKARSGGPRRIGGLASALPGKPLIGSMIGRPVAGMEERSRRAARLVADAAADAGLLDVAYGFVDSPFGRLLVAMSRRGLVRVAYPNRTVEDVLADLSEEISPRVLESARATDEIRRELEEYFGGQRRTFGVRVDLSAVRGFSKKVLQQTARIPFGSVITYRDVATRAGSPRAVRAAGNALGANPIPIVVPCHRVVRTGGGLGGYTGGLERKEVLLTLEGVPHPGKAPVRNR
jgi:methylated-DNA-[protein]-cysteine S-methyltransferase